MKIIIEIPDNFVKDYETSRFAHFFAKVILDIDYKGVCDKHEEETAAMLTEAFINSCAI